MPTLGDATRLDRLLVALDRQTLAHDRWELVVAVDSPRLDPDIERRIVAFSPGARTVRAGGGPGAARNRGVAAARSTWIAFTEDDCTPAPDWLERAAAALASHPEAEVLTGTTLKPGGRPVHRQRGKSPLYLPTNLFVRRDTYARAGGYCEDFFEPASRVYFREDSDFGFTLEDVGANVVFVPEARVEHPDEHPGFWDPVRWARRHLMDPLLAARHPLRFRDSIEVHHIGPVGVRRPIVRMCMAFVMAIVAAALTTMFGALLLGGELMLIAFAALMVIWAKWRFDPRRLPILPIVPFVVVWSLLEGQQRAARIMKHTELPRDAGSGGPSGPA